jgi:hypothetical protein
MYRVLHGCSDPKIITENKQLLRHCCSFRFCLSCPTLLRPSVSSLKRLNKESDKHCYMMKPTKSEPRVAII